jgi:hypothetical protein
LQQKVKSHCRCGNPTGSYLEAPLAPAMSIVSKPSDSIRPNLMGLNGLDS